MDGYCPTQEFSGILTTPLDQRRVPGSAVCAHFEVALFDVFRVGLYAEGVIQSARATTRKLFNTFGVNVFDVRQPRVRSATLGSGI